MVRGCRGGASVAWRLLDSQYWGTPQRRKRIFLVGDFRAERAPQILFECESVLGYTETRGKERKGIAPASISDFKVAGGLDPNSCVADFGRTADRIYYNAEKARTLTATTGGGGSATGNYLDISEIRPINLQVATRYEADASYYKGTGARSGMEREFVAVCYAPSSYGTYKDGFGPLRQTGFGDSENLIVILKKIAYWIKYELRKLTPLECERLQGFPDYWTKYGESGKELPDTPRYKALGNSLTVQCAERVFRGIVAMFANNK